jgi:hypothetical protein
MFSNNAPNNNNSDDEQYFYIKDTGAVWNGWVIMVIFTAIEIFLIYNLFF